METNNTHEQKRSAYQHSFELGVVTVAATQAGDAAARARAAFIANIFEPGSGMPGVPQSEVTFETAPDVNPAQAATIILEAPKVVLR